jgi:tetratricopeptide (TPR) repeat protein
MTVMSAKSEVFRQALAAQAQGRFEEAIGLCRAILQVSPGEFDVWHLLAFAQAARGQHVEALGAYRQALSLKASDPTVHYNRAVSLHALHRWSEAVESYDAALAIRAAFPEALSNRGNALRDMRKLSDALASYEAALALRPDYFAALNNRALVLQELERFDDAIVAYDQALAVMPDHADAHRERGNVLHRLKRFDEAVTSYDAALALQPNDADALSNRATSLLDLKRPQDALASCDAALAIRPHYFEALNNRGLALLALARPEDALTSFDAALALRPTDPPTLNNRANVLAQLNRFDEAMASYDAALAMRPDYLEAWTNRGNTLQKLRRFDDALASYQAALAIRPDYAEAHFASAFCKLRIGDFASGWDAYEWRWETAQQRGTNRSLPQPLWDGREAVADRTILIHAEQGFGDTIQFCRYVPLLAEKGARVVLEVQPALRRLLQGLPGAQTVLARGDPLPAFDLQCPTLSLPRAFATRLSTIPAPPRLHIPADLIDTWNSRLPSLGKMRVGIVWTGTDRYRAFSDQTRSIGLEQILALNSLPVQLVSLQKELSDEDQSVLATRGIAHFGPELTDFLETATLASLMDLVIAIDTGAAHLAATLGRETWILLPFTPDWRWLLDRVDSPWYPSARLFRQPAPGDWASVMATVRSELAARL